MWVEFLQDIFNLVLVPLFAVLTIYLIRVLNAQADKIKETTDSTLVQKYIGTLNDIIVTCVIATNQTYVESLKKQNAFTKEAQKEAFKKTYESVKSILSDEAEEVLSMVYEDLDGYIKQQIEMMVHSNKMEFNFYARQQGMEVQQNTEPPINYEY